jgi:hypothetical protein
MGTASRFGESPWFEEEDVGVWVIGRLESLGRKGRLALWTGCKKPASRLSLAQFMVSVSFSRSWRPM